jgi:hypothetical protein
MARASRILLLLVASRPQSLGCGASKSHFRSAVIAVIVFDVTESKGHPKIGRIQGRYFRVSAYYDNDQFTATTV